MINTINNQKLCNYSNVKTIVVCIDVLSSSTIVLTDVKRVLRQK